MTAAAWFAQNATYMSFLAGLLAAWLITSILLMGLIAIAVLRRFW